MGKYYKSLKKIMKNDVYRNSTSNEKLRKKLEKIFEEENRVDIRDIPKKLNNYFENKYDKKRVEELPTILIFNDRLVVSRKKK